MFFGNVCFSFSISWGYLLSFLFILIFSFFPCPTRVHNKAWFCSLLQPSAMVFHSSLTIRQDVLNDFIENQAFSPSYDSAPSTPYLLPSPVSKLSLFLSLPICCRSSILPREGVQGSQIIRRKRKPWSSINHSILSALGNVACFVLFLMNTGP
jgi:hypothetical protein